MSKSIPLPIYKKEEFKQPSWEKYGQNLKILGDKVVSYVKENDIHIDAVVPILRGGMVPALYLAHKLHMLNIMPIQYKYFFKNGKIQLKKLSKKPTASFKLSPKPTFLLVEGNHCFGLTAATAAKDLRKYFPECEILYAADYMDYSYQNIVLAKAVFYGTLTNETKALTPEQAEKLGISQDLTLFPWEDLEEEWTTVQGKQFPYKELL